MNEKLISRLVLGALVGLAATGAYAGQIQSSSVSIAREVITADTQAVNTPSVSYRFAGDVDARLQTQTFQVQFTLGNGAEWATAGADNAIVVTDGVSGLPSEISNAANSGNLPVYSIVAKNLSTDKKTLWVTIRVAQASNALIRQPIVTIGGQAYITVDNAGGHPGASTPAAAPTKPTVVKLKQVVGTVGECDTAVKTLPVSFKHYVALSNPSDIADDVTATPDEHTRGGATNSTTLITFPTNILIAVNKSIGDNKIDVATSGVSFATSNPGGTFVATDVNGNGSAYRSSTLANLGNVRATQNAQGYDSNLADNYLLSDAGVTSVAAAGVATSSTVAGEVEVKQVDVKVSASQGFVEGGSLFLSAVADCSAALASTTVAISSTNAAGPITLTIPTATIANAFDATGASPVHVCYQVPSGASAKLIPASSFYVDAATWVKAPAGTVDTNEQDNFCKGPLYPLSGSIKIDVRNYAAKGRTDGWMSVIRLINNSETRIASVYGQYIHADGKYGKWGKLADLAPRAVLNMTPDQVDAKLTSAPAHATVANNATAAVPATGDAPRLRITTETGDTLRVQNYLYNPASENFIEASSSQGVDFSGSNSRAPASEGQYQDQDAQKGLNGGN